MEYIEWVGECQQLLERFEQSVQTVQSLIKAESGYAYYQDDERLLHGEDARAAIAEHLGQFFYADDDGSRITPNRYMAAACSPHTLEVVNGLGGLNHTKLLFKRFHEALRAQFKTEAEATNAMRDVLRHSQAKLLNIEAVDRRVPVLPGPAFRITWYINETAPSARKTVGDALNHLYKLSENASAERQMHLQEEITQLQSLSASTPVSHRLRKPIKVLKFRSSFLNLDGRRRNRSDYGRNPVLFLDQGVAPTLELPGTGPSGDGRGRPSTVSDRALSKSLPNWFFYLDQVEQSKARPPKQPAIQRNPNAGTAISGIWFYKNASGNPGFRFRNFNGAVSSVSIKYSEKGLQEAWGKAIDKAFPLKTIEEREGFYKLCPSQTALDKFTKPKRNMPKNGK